MTRAKIVVGALIALCSALGVGGVRADETDDVLMGIATGKPLAMPAEWGATSTNTSTSTTKPLPPPTLMTEAQRQWKPDPHRVERAARKIAFYARMAGVKEPIGVTVDLSPAVYPGSVLAHTTRNAYASGCTVHATEQALDLDWVLAHEVCHCAADYDVLNASGYVKGVSTEEHQRREDAAQVCGGKLRRREQLRMSSSDWWRK